MVELLERSLSGLDEWPGSTDDDERRLRREGVCDGRDHTGDARAGGDDGDAAGSFDAAPCLGCVRGGLLVPHIHDAHPLESAALVDRHHMPAAEREDRVHALRRDCLGREPPALNLFCHAARA